MSSDPSWKDKYLQALDSSEQRESHWEAERNLLQRMLVRTSLASEGQTAELDRLLERVRDELRKPPLNADSWRDLQERIDRQVAALDDRKSESTDRLRATFEQLLSELRSHPMFKSGKDRIRDLEKRLRKPETLQLDATGWLVDLALVLETGLGSGDGQDRKRSRFGRLFGGRGSQEPSDQPMLAEAAENTLASSAVELAMPGTEDNERLKIARRVGELLGHMLDQVTLEAASEARARRLQESLLNSDNWDELREGLSSVAELVIAAVTRGQREFEAFLRRLDERLDALRQCFAEQANAQAGRLDASQELDRDIRQELRSFGQQVESSVDFDGLKDSVSQHLETISGAVERFREQESERERNLSLQLELMQEKLVTMEAQSEQVREKLREEREKALTDVLTQLPNREAWQERLSFEYQRWQRYRHSLSVCVLDIDLFKRVNDLYGHRAGDRVLQLVARALRERLRATDFIARFGGEEFVILLPETHVDNARSVLDSMRGHIAELPFHFRGEPVSVTFSAGLAEFDGDDDEDDVFDRADKALYLAKDSGRDQVLIAGRDV
ncbi:diguanylate cyclase [Marinobacter salarius]|uniref:diguanylate cyclase n=1 Tax=Marinobacter salarius TaxID=1420917 RepID=UPI003D9C60A6